MGDSYVESATGESYETMSSDNPIDVTNVIASMRSLTERDREVIAARMLVEFPELAGPGAWVVELNDAEVQDLANALRERIAALDTKDAPDLSAVLRKFLADTIKAGPVVLALQAASIAAGLERSGDAVPF